MFDRLVFFQPQKNIAGGSLILFARIIEYLIRTGEYRLCLVDFEDGYIRNYLGSQKYEFASFQTQAKIELQQNDLLITSLNRFNNIFTTFVFHPNTKLFFWDLGPYSLILSHMVLGNTYKGIKLNNARRVAVGFEFFRKKRIKQFIETATDNYGLFYMSKKIAYYNQKFFGAPVKPQYLAIPVNSLEQNQYSFEINQQNIRIAWLSRLEIGKTKALKKLLNDIVSLRETNKITLAVIGEGKEKENIKAVADKCGLSIDMIGRIEHNELNNYILNNVDIGFGMGTSALEFAKLGIPTVLTSGENTLANDHETKRNYTWLFDALDYNLTAEPYLYDYKNTKSLDNIFEEFFCNHQLISDHCFNHVKNYHDFNMVMVKLKSNLHNNSLTYSKIDKLKLLSDNILDQLLRNLLKMKKAFIKIANYINK